MITQAVKGEIREQYEKHNGPSKGYYDKIHQIRSDSLNDKPYLLRTCVESHTNPKTTPQGDYFIDTRVYEWMNDKEVYAHIRCRGTLDAMVSLEGVLDEIEKNQITPNFLVALVQFKGFSKSIPFFSGHMYRLHCNIANS